MARLSIIAIAIVAVLAGTAMATRPIAGVGTSIETVPAGEPTAPGLLFDTSAPPPNANGADAYTPPPDTMPAAQPTVKRITKPVIPVAPTIPVMFAKELEAGLFALLRFKTETRKAHRHATPTHHHQAQ
ncbi:hypothetical protein NA57DRAFT_57314 [Rhizodiscina lignyota]|uniref:Uncharacterized protein n=1 Tax=Rhizodiscina lignyota TaxID=1504668 RepID=A0A9P4IDR2_9PEZI|nr:hypothetical protein NA57DRAFT_57314 [Rhizodiscina lignyota]